MKTDRAGCCNFSEPTKTRTRNSVLEMYNLTMTYADTNRKRVQNKSLLYEKLDKKRNEIKNGHFKNS